MELPPFLCTWTALICLFLALFVFLLTRSLYRSHVKLRDRCVFNGTDELPGWLYLLGKIAVRAMLRRQGHQYRRDSTNQASVFTVHNCRLQEKELRHYCAACGYGYDHPDSVHRDIPLCYPEVLFFRLLTMIVCADGFQLSPLGLIHIRQTIRSFQPVDELKKGPFLLQASVQEYRATDMGVEVDVLCEIKNRALQSVWEGTMTCLSRDWKQLARRKQHSDTPEPEEVTRVDLFVPWSTGIRYAFVSSDYNPHHLISLTARLLGYKQPIAHGLWMISRCLCEIEKYRGVKAVQAPVTVKATFKQPLFMPGRASIAFWEDSGAGNESTFRRINFRMESETGIPHLIGEIAAGTVSTST